MFIIFSLTNFAWFGKCVTSRLKFITSEMRVEDIFFNIKEDISIVSLIGKSFGDKILNELKNLQRHFINLKNWIKMKNIKIIKVFKEKFFLVFGKSIYWFNAVMILSSTFVMFIQQKSHEFQNFIQQKEF
jgi:hypothetical protein